MERVELQWISRVIAFQRDDGPECVKLVFSEPLSPILVGSREGRLQLTQAIAAVTGAVFDWPDLGIASTWAAERLVCRTVLY
ncbi:hypothetical protein [Fodinicola acaciae]|uniref:hypothetical protein n=1 Tax=Fodinicola acaciae TaxID=2681555 RepID=UPI001FEC3241|nr:hypothetical protein [Fodinicola acaciae]